MDGQIGIETRTDRRIRVPLPRPIGLRCERCRVEIPIWPVGRGWGPGLSPWPTSCQCPECGNEYRITVRSLLDRAPYAVLLMDLTDERRMREEDEARWLASLAR